MSKHHDIDRLEKIAVLYKKMQEVFYHMDEKEYARMRDYMYSRFGLLLNSLSSQEKPLEDTH